MTGVYRPGRWGSLRSRACRFAWLAVFFSSFALADGPAVAAAAALRFALTEIAVDYQRASGEGVRLSFGSSGNFRRQIAQGAPFELFLSADEGYVRALQRDGHTLDEGLPYALGRVAWFVPRGSPLVPDEHLAGLASALEQGRLGRFAIANPEHAPYGRAAREALEHAGLWEAIQPNLVLGENAAQATQFAASGSTDGGLIPYALALAPGIAGRGRYVLLPQASHRPLRQRMVLIKGAGDGARRFYSYLQSPRARTQFRRFGFLPDEES